MLHGLARTEIEVVEPLPIEFSQATPVIARPSEAMQWLNAHHVHSPVTRHALVVLESIDAIDLAFDTFVCTLLDGEVDTSGYPDYSAVVGGVAAHWDEATGDMIVRSVVGWGGKGVRGDTDRIAAKLLAGILTNVLANQHALGLTAVDRPVPGRRTRWPRLRPLRVRLGPRAGVLLPEVRHAPPPRLTRGRPTRRCPPTITSARTAHRFEVIHSVTADGPTTCPVCGAAPVRKAFSAPTIHFKGSGWAKKDRQLGVPVRLTGGVERVRGGGRRGSQGRGRARRRRTRALTRRAAPRRKRAPKAAGKVAVGRAKERERLDRRQRPPPAAD